MTVDRLDHPQRHGVFEQQSRGCEWYGADIRRLPTVHEQLSTDRLRGHHPMVGPERTQKDPCDLLRFRLDRPTAGDARANRKSEQDTWRPTGDDASDECDSEKSREHDRVRAPDSAREANEREHDTDSEDEELRRAIRRLPTGR